MEKPISKWNDKRLRVGWTIRLANGKLAIVTWICNGQMMAKPIESNGGETNV